MILVDTCVWIDHLHRGIERMEELLRADLVLCHKLIWGEIACGNLSDRERVLTLLNKLPPAPEADHYDVTRLLEAQRLYGQGLGWIDVHLLASAQIAGCNVWTSDKRMLAAAKLLKLAWTP